MNRMSTVRWIAIALGVVSFARISAMAGDAGDAAANLEKLGAKVTRVKGVARQADVNAAMFTPNDFKTLGECRSLTRLFIRGKTINDENLPLLARLADLEDLGTDGTMLSDDGYKHFAQFPKLRSLSLFHPSWDKKDFTGRGLAHLKLLPKLERLTFAGSTAGDAAIEAVAQLSQLKEFHTWHTAQTQAGNEALAKSNLVTLKMGQRLPRGPKSPPSFDAKSIPIFARIGTLEKFEIFEARLTAADLAPLKSLPKLKSLKIHTTDISADDVETVRKMLPGVKVDFRPLTPEERDDTLVKKLRL